MTIPPISTREVLPLSCNTDIVLTRHAVLRRAVKLGFSLTNLTKMVTAASELARNTLEHGGGGEVVVESIVDGTRQGLRAVFTDKGQDGFREGHWSWPALHSGQYPGDGPPIVWEISR